MENNPSSGSSLLLPMALRWLVCVLGFLLLLGFHANRSTLNSTWLGPVGETTPPLQRGQARILFRTMPPPSTQSPIPDGNALISTSVLGMHSRMYDERYFEQLSLTIFKSVTVM
jgi:hypothetical protein